LQGPAKLATRGHKPAARGTEKEALKLTYYSGQPNFGDVLSPLLATRLFGEIFDQDDSERLLFIGTVIRRSAPKGCHETILGAGAGYHAGRYSLERRRVLCVRGPLTCKILGVDQMLAAIDPAILTSRIYASGTGATGACLFMPHHASHASAGSQLRAACATAGLEYVSPLDDAERTIGKIRGARRVISEALHGAVVAESYQVPWVPVVFGSKVLTEKWRDFTASIGVDYQPVEIHTNAAFSGDVRLLDRLKYTLAKAGVGKKKYKYLPIKKATPSTLSTLERKLRALAASDLGLVRATSIKAASIARLDAAIAAFTEASHRIAGARAAF
jgi:succinoglycan biosynthesis protein ExoV